LNRVKIKMARNRHMPGRARHVHVKLFAMTASIIAMVWTSSKAIALTVGLNDAGGPIQFLPSIDRMLSHLGQPSGSAGWLMGFQVGILGVCLSGGSFLLVETVLLLVLELFPGLLSQFAARKICHAGTGLLMLTLDSGEASARAAVWLVAVSSILMTWNITKAVGIPPFRFGAEKDIGITIYLLLVMFWFYAELPPTALSPMFFADPSGAVVGKFLTRKGFSNPAWYEKKTVGGSIAVFLVTLGTLLAFYPPLPVGALLLLSTVASIAEAVGGAYDNLCLASVVIGGYVMLAR